MTRHRLLAGPVPIGWITVVILLLMATVSYLDRQIISLMVEPIKADLKVGDFEIGLLQGIAFGAFYALCGLPLGWMVDRFQRRIVIFSGVSLWSLATIACGLAGSFSHLLLARFFVGIGEASLSPAAYSILADLFPRKRLALVMSVFGLGTVIGSVLAFVIGGLLIGHFADVDHFTLPLLGDFRPWQIIFGIVGLPGLIVAILIFLVPEPKRDIHAAVVGTTATGVMPFLRGHKRYFLCHFAGFSCMGIQAYATGAWLPVLMIRRFDIGATTVGPLMGLVLMVGALPGFLWSGWFIDRWFSRGTTDAHLRYFVYTCALSAVVGAIAFGFSNSLLMLIPLAILLQFILPVTGAAGAHLQIVTPPQYRGRISALFMLVFNLIGMCVGPTSVGFITDFVFGDPGRVNASLAIVYTLAGLTSSALFAWGLEPARRAVAASESADRPESRASPSDDRISASPAHPLAAPLTGTAR